MKKLLYVIGGFVAIVVIAIVALITLVNPNQFKPLITEQFESNTGMSITLDGDINWRFFPSLGLSIDRMYIDNPAEFSSDKLLSVDKVGVGVQVLPLLSKQLYVEQVELANAAFSFETLKDGRTNLDAFTASTEAEGEITSQSEPLATNEPSATDEPSPVSEQPEEGWSIEVAGVSITDSQIQVRDASAGTNLLLENVNLTLTEFGFERWSQLALTAQGQHNSQQFSVDLDTQFWIDAQVASPQLKALTVTSTYSDPVVEVSEFILSMDHFELDTWIPISLTTKMTSSGQKIEADFGLELLLESNLNQYQLRNIGLSSSVAGEGLTVSQFDVAMPTFGFDVANPLSITIKGDADGLQFDNQLETQLWIDEAITALKLAQLSFASNLQGDTLPYSPMSIDWSGGVDYDLSGSKATVKISQFAIDEMVFTGQIAADISQAIPAITYSINSNNVDVDALFAKGEPTNTDGAKSEDSSDAVVEDAPSAATEPDLSALKQIKLAGRTNFKRFKASNIIMSNLKTDVAVDDGVAMLKSLTAGLYDGTLNVNATLNGQQAEPTYNGKVVLTKVKAKPLLVALADTDVLEGQASTTTTFEGQSLIPDNLMRNLVGVSNVSFSDGAINGINLAQIIRDNYAKLKGQSAEQSEVKKTDFSALSGEFRFNKGNVTTDDFAMQSPLLRVTAQGAANYLDQDIDALTKVSIVGSLEGQGGDSINDLKDLTIPLTIRGPWADPKFGVDFAALQAQELERNKAKLEEKAKKEAERGLKKLLGDQAEDDEVKKLSDKLLKGLFN
jgi:AsmA protein